MKRLLLVTLVSIVLIITGLQLPHSPLEVDMEIPDAAAANEPGSSGSPGIQIVSGVPTIPHAAPVKEAVPDRQSKNPYGELYFLLGGFEKPYHLVRLPGDCVVGLIDCPEPEIVSTPFDARGMLGSLVWSPDATKAIAVTQIYHEGEERPILPPTTVYVYDIQKETWDEIYQTQADISAHVVWSQDGSWIALKSWEDSPAANRIFVVRPDGNDLRAIQSGSYDLIGWIGGSVLVKHFSDVSNTAAYAVEMLNPIDGQATSLFTSDRPAYLFVSPDSSSLAAADYHSVDAPTPLKQIDVLALDGSQLFDLGSYSNPFSSIYPVVWSSDGSQIAFNSFGRMFVLTPGSDPRLVFQADQTFSAPSIWRAAFSPDGEHLLLETYNGFPVFVVLAVDESKPYLLVWEGQTNDDQLTLPSWRP
jgi:hypothetical protein